MPAPAVSVLMPVYNGGEFLDAAIASVRAQTFADLEMVIVDDGSVDESAETLARHAAADPRIRLLSQPHAGIAAALCRALEVAGGSLVARMDADDIALPHRLERQLAAMAAAPGAAVVGSNYIVIDRLGARRGTSNLPIHPADVRSRLEHGNCIAHPTVLMRRDWIVAAGGYRRAFVQCEDYDLWLRLSERHDLLNLAEPLLLYRHHPGQLEWGDVEQRALSVLGARLAASWRRAGAPDPTDGCELITRAFLRRIGIDDQQIDGAIISWAVQAAVIALRTGDRRAARRALAAAERQGHLRLATRLACWLLRARSYV